MNPFNFDTQHDYYLSTLIAKINKSSVLTITDSLKELENYLPSSNYSSDYQIILRTLKPLIASPGKAVINRIVYFLAKKLGKGTLDLLAVEWLYENFNNKEEIQKIEKIKSEKYSDVLIEKYFVFEEFSLECLKILSWEDPTKDLQFFKFLLLKTSHNYHLTFEVSKLPLSSYIEFDLLFDILRILKNRNPIAFQYFNLKEEMTDASHTSTKPQLFIEEIFLTVKKIRTFIFMTRKYRILFHIFNYIDSCIYEDAVFLDNKLFSDIFQLSSNLKGFKIELVKSSTVDHLSIILPKIEDKQKYLFSILANSRNYMCLFEMLQKIEGLEMELEHYSNTYLINNNCAFDNNTSASDNNNSNNSSAFDNNHINTSTSNSNNNSINSTFNEYYLGYLKKQDKNKENIKDQNICDEIPEHQNKEFKFLVIYMKIAKQSFERHFSTKTCRCHCTDDFIKTKLKLLFHFADKKTKIIICSILGKELDISNYTELEVDELMQFSVDVFPLEYFLGQLKGRENLSFKSSGAYLLKKYPFLLNDQNFSFDHFITLFKNTTPENIIMIINDISTLKKYLKTLHNSVIRRLYYLNTNPDYKIAYLFYLRNEIDLFDVNYSVVFEHFFEKDFLIYLLSRNNNIFNFIDNSIDYLKNIKIPNTILYNSYNFDSDPKMYYNIEDVVIEDNTPLDVIYNALISLQASSLESQITYCSKLQILLHLIEIILYKHPNVSNNIKISLLDDNFLNEIKGQFYLEKNQFIFERFLAEVTNNNSIYGIKLETLEINNKKAIDVIIRNIVIPKEYFKNLNTSFISNESLKIVIDSIFITEGIIKIKDSNRIEGLSEDMNYNKKEETGNGVDSLNNSISNNRESGNGVNTLESSISNNRESGNDVNPSESSISNDKESGNDVNPSESSISNNKEQTNGVDSLNNSISNLSCNSSLKSSFSNLSCSSSSISASSLVKKFFHFSPVKSILDFISLIEKDKILLHKKLRDERLSLYAPLLQAATEIFSRSLINLYCMIKPEMQSRDKIKNNESSVEDMGPKIPGNVVTPSNLDNDAVFNLIFSELEAFKGSFWILLCNTITKINNIYVCSFIEEMISKYLEENNDIREFLLRDQNFNFKNEISNYLTIHKIIPLKNFLTICTENELMCFALSFPNLFTRYKIKKQLEMEKYLISICHTKIDNGKLSFNKTPDFFKIKLVYRADSISHIAEVKIPCNYPFGKPRIEFEKDPKSTKFYLKLNELLGRTSKFIEIFFLWKIDIDNHLLGHSECLICYFIMDPKYKLLPNFKCETCKNIFHDKCMFKWAVQSKKAQCPFCRSDLDLWDKK